jgi:AbrB family looped-hinge helix DNA binding protein
MMNLAKLTTSGQVTVPVEIRSFLNLKVGDKVLFVRNENGEVVINNASINAIRKAQTAFMGVAESLGNPGETDMQTWVDDIRYGEDTKK